MEQHKIRDLSEDVPRDVQQGADQDGQVRTILLTVARSLLANNSKFSLQMLLTQTGMSRSQFRRCFASKEQLLAALAGEDVKMLGGILESAQPVTIVSASSRHTLVRDDVTPPPPAADAWLERRLRVFERVLTALEKRQEKFEQECSRQLALMKEKLLQENSVQTIATQSQIDAPENRADVIYSAEKMVNSSHISAPVILAHDEKIALTEDEPIARPASEYVSAKEMEDFLERARHAARRAAEGASSRPKRRAFPSWLAWSAVVAMAMLVTAEFLFIGSAMGRVAVPVAAVRHATTQTGFARIIALADSGDSRAQTLLALASLRWQGGGSDKMAARRWSLAAAKQGQPLAQYLLGTLYLDSDASEATHWFAAAADQGNVKAMHNLAIAYAEGLGVEKDPAKAVLWFGRAAAEGYRDSEFDLAVLYERGLGVAQSEEAALTWYLIAAKQGDGPSAERAQFLQQQMSSAIADRAAARASTFVPQPVIAAANDPPAI